MRYTITSAVLIAATASTVGAASLINGNWYGNLTDRIAYKGWGTAGVYHKVTDMSAGNCVKEPVAYAGGMAPLDGEVSFHFRGPMHLKQFAFYTPGSSSSKRNVRPTRHQKRHSHGHLHRKRDVGDWVTVTMNGQVETWINQYSGPPATSTSTTIPTSSSPPSTSNTAASSSPKSFLLDTSSPSSSTSSPSSPTSYLLPIPLNNPDPNPAANAGAITWSRQSYYSVSLPNSIADGLTFLNNHGTPDDGTHRGSGTWDFTFGASLSYASPDGLTDAATPQVLDNILLPDDTEVILYTDKPCLSSDTIPCDPYRPGAVAYHGFSGPSKLFLMEFSMPMSNVTGSLNADMPSIWILNAAIPRTEQYGSCSCWPECGEWDIFEVLNPGNTRAKSTIHAGVSGSELDYFERPVDKTIKAAVWFEGGNSTGHIMVLPDDVVFGTNVAGSTLVEWGQLEGANGTNGTVFDLGSS